MNFESQTMFSRCRLSAKALHARCHSRRLALDSTPVSGRTGGRERMRVRFHTRERESGRGTRSRSSPVPTRSPAPTGEVAARLPPSRAAACAGHGHLPQSALACNILQHPASRAAHLIIWRREGGKQETERGRGGVVVENERERCGGAGERIGSSRDDLGRLGAYMGCLVGWVRLLLAPSPFFFIFSFSFFFIIDCPKLLF